MHAPIFSYAPRLDINPQQEQQQQQQRVGHEAIGGRAASQQGMHLAS